MLCLGYIYIYIYILAQQGAIRFFLLFFTSLIEVVNEKWHSSSVAIWLLDRAGLVVFSRFAVVGFWRNNFGALIQLKAMVQI